MGHPPHYHAVPIAVRGTSLAVSSITTGVIEALLL